MDSDVITWKLIEIMDREGIKPGDLAELMDVHPRQVTRLRKVTMPGVDQEKLGKLLLSLNILKRPESPLITADTLIVFSLTPDELKRFEAAQRKKP